MFLVLSVSHCQIYFSLIKLQVPHKLSLHLDDFVRIKTGLQVRLFSYDNYFQTRIVKFHESNRDKKKIWVGGWDRVITTFSSESLIVYSFILQIIIQDGLLREGLCSVQDESAGYLFIFSHRRNGYHTRKSKFPPSVSCFIRKIYQN